MTSDAGFDAYARCYDLLYRDKDYAGEAAFVHRQLQRWQPGARDLLELGCGTGAHAVQFAELGYGIHGIDLSGRMIDRAMQRRESLAPAIAARLQFEQGDIRHIAQPGRSDAVISLFHVMSYQTGDDDLALALASAERHLQPGGVLLFDFWYGPAVLRDLPAVRVKRMEDDFLKVIRLAEPTLHDDCNVAEIHYQLVVQDKRSSRMEEIHETHRLRYWFWPELRSHFRNAGLEPLGLWEWMTELPADARSWLAYAVCRRPLRDASA